MPDLETSERTARRMLGLAAALAVVACIVLVVDMSIKQTIIRKAEEVQRELLGARQPGDGATGRSDDQPVGGVGDAAAVDPPPDPVPDAAAAVG